MAFENKILRLIAGVDTRDKMYALFKYFKDNDIKLNPQQLRTALNRLSMLDEGGDDTST